MVERDFIAFPGCEIEWSEWKSWDCIRTENNTILSIPKQSGVYEVRRKGEDQCRLHIGMASSLLNRIRNGLVKGQMPHSTGERIRAKEDTLSLEVRWAEVALADARLIEELLKWRHRRNHGGDGPIYGKH
jgi:hypothetical protein